MCVRERESASICAHQFIYIECKGVSPTTFGRWMASVKHKLGVVSNTYHDSNHICRVAKHKSTQKEIICTCLAALHQNISRIALGKYLLGHIFIKERRRGRNIGYTDSGGKIIETRTGQGAYNVAAQPLIKSDILIFIAGRRACKRQKMAININIEL